MDFSKALKETDREERNHLIEDLIYATDWCEAVSENVDHGGGVHEADVQDIEIQESDDTIRIAVTLSFVESVSTSCKEINANYPGTAYLSIAADKGTGIGTVTNLDVDAADVPRIASGDIY